MLNTLSIIEIVVFSLFMLSLVIQLGYYWGVFSHLAFFKRKTSESGKLEPVSIIICARNEAKNLRKHLFSVLDQTYPEFEVIVVNDCSWDDSGAFLEQVEAKYKNLRVLTIVEQEKYRHGKKFALTLGIKAAKHELLLLTDADCLIPGKNWLSTMQNNFDSKSDLVLGYGAYKKQPGLLNRLIRFDTFYTALQYFSYSMMGMTYMGVGRNIAYRKSLFFKNKGFASHQHILSGDDDLFVNQVATKTNIKLELDPQAFTYSEPKTSFWDWFLQKKRHYSTGKFYKSKHKLTLGIFGLSHFVFYTSIIVLAILNCEWHLLVILFLIRLISQMIIFGKAMKVLGESDVLWLAPLFDFFNFIFYPLLTVINLIFKVDKWK